MRLLEAHVFGEVEVGTDCQPMIPLLYVVTVPFEEIVQRRHVLRFLTNSNPSLDEMNKRAKERRRRGWKEVVLVEK